MKLIIGADFVPTDSNVKYFESGELEYLFDQELISYLSQPSFKIFNLEMPLTDTDFPIKKNGPALRANPNAINLYKKLGVNLVTLANNHILDQGAQGLERTISILDASGISYVGAGNNLLSAVQAFSFMFEKHRVGVYACTEHEFSLADDTTPGANPFDPLESYDHINALKNNCDYVIVLYHGGKEHYRYPSPDLQRYCRKFVQKGADLVICQHSHCIGCMEKIENSTIIYGQGNFLFDHSESEYWKTGLLIEIDSNLQIKYIPVIKNGFSVQMADEKHGKSILDDFNSRSNQILEEGIIQRKYADFAQEMLRHYYSNSLGRIGSNIFFRIINKLLKAAFFRWNYNEKYNLALLNSIECEAHRELFAEGLKRTIYKKER